MTKATGKPGGESVLRLIQDGLCSVADVREAQKEADRLRGSEVAARIRSLEIAFKTLSDSNRITILAMLASREMCVCEITSSLNISQPTASRNLNMLERAGLVLKSRRGKWAFYSLSDSPLVRLIGEYTRGSW